MSPIPSFSAVSFHSLAQFATALTWAAALLFSLTGFGALFLRIFGLKRPRFTLAATVAFGPAVLLGGLLNLGHLIYRPVLIVFVVVGAGLAATLIDLWDWVERSRPEAGIGTRPSVAARALFAAVILIFGLRIAATVRDGLYLDVDDFYYYLAAPVKMLETHQYAAEPYSERRIISSIGGNDFLETLVLAAQPLESVQMADWTLGAALLLLLALALADVFRLTPAQRYALALFLLITPQIRFNLTFVILPSALFIGMLYVAVHRRLTLEFPVLQAAALGSMAGAVTAMKSHYIVHSVLFILLIAGLRARKRGLSSGARLLGIAALCCLAVMLPWMLANRADTGTMFYPILGRGLHYSAYGLYPMPTGFNLRILLTKVVPFCAPIFALFLLAWFAAEREEPSDNVVIFSFMAFLATFVTATMTAGDSIRRYNYPVLLPAIALLYLLISRRHNLHPAQQRWKWLQAASAVLAVITAINVGLSSFTVEYKATWQGLRASIGGYRAATLDLREEYAALDRAIPAGSVSLIYLHAPFLLDFSRHTLLSADFPGAASPPPGWPARQNGEALVRFLRGHGIRYLVFSYNDCKLEHGFNDCEQWRNFEAGALMAASWSSQIIRNEVMAGYDARRQFEKIGRKHPHEFDDGKIFVVDLNSPALGAP